MNLSSVSNAVAALTIVDGALSIIDEQRSEFGTRQNRFSSTIAKLQNVSENLRSAKLPIQGTDFAQEAVNPR